MINLGRVFRDYRQAGALNALVNIHAAIDHHTFLTKGGDLLLFLKTEGVDAECLDPLRTDQITRRFASTIRTFDESYRICQYLVRRPHGAIPHGDYTDPIVAGAVRDRAAYLETKGLYRTEIYYALMYEHARDAIGSRGRLADWATNPISALQAALSTEKRIALLDEELKRNHEALLGKALNAIAQMSDLVRIKVLDKNEVFPFLRRLLNYAPYKVEGARLAYDDFVDWQMCGSALECHRDHLRLDNYRVQVLTLKDPPAQTSANLFRKLQNIDAAFVAVSEWKRADNASVRSMIRSKRRHFHNSKASILNYPSGSERDSKNVLTDDSAVAQVTELGLCLQELESDGSFGEFSLTILAYNEDDATLRHTVAECFKVFASVDAQLIEERANLLNAFLAILPGNHAFNLRRMWLTGANYADLSFLFAPYPGSERNKHLSAEYLAIFETNQRTAYFYSPHVGDVAHTIIVGATGSGKSFTLKFLLTHLQKYQPLTYIFDLGRSYDHLTRLFGGTYVAVGLDNRDFTINPFSLPPTPENIEFLCSFVRVLAESSGYHLTAQDERDLFEQIQNMYAIEPTQRRLLTLANILGRNLRQALQKWVQGGQYGYLFDNTTDNLTFARFQTFDFEGMQKAPQVLEPLLFYILHRAQTAIHDPQLARTFKVFVIDEAWQFLQNPTIRAYIQEGLKTWRKKNAAMILATQSGDDLVRSEMLSVVTESCATQIFLANPGMDRHTYQEAFHLSETEAEQIANLIPKQQLLLKRPDMTKILNLNVERSRPS